MVPQRRRGFTIVEVLVVIGIIAVLASILFVALRSALATAAKTGELNSLRNISLGWSMYAGANADYVMPGYLEEDVQEAWRLEWRNVRGEVLTPEVAAPYTWRLAPYVEFSYDILMGYRDDGVKELNALEEEEVALRPAFGYNGLYVGGWWETVTEGTNEFQAMRYDLISEPGFRGIVTRTIGGVQRPTELITFAASSEQPAGIFRNAERGAGVPGFHLAVPAIVAEQPRWANFESGNASIEVFTDGPVPLYRHSVAIAITTADGGVRAASIGELLDQRRWIDIATAADWSHPPE